MFMIVNAAILSLWITSLAAFGKSYIHYLKEERAYEKARRTDSG